MKRFPRKNDADSIRARQEALGLDGEVVGFDLEPWRRAAEQLTGAAVIPVSVAGPLVLSLGSYELDDTGSVLETGRSDAEVFVPLAHTEGGLTASMQRGIRAVTESGGFRTHVLADRITRASCFVCADAAEALALARWIEGEVESMREWLRSAPLPELSRFAVLREVKTHVVGPMCHVLWRWTTGDAVGPNMMTRNAYALNMGYVMERAPVKPSRAMLEANMGGDKKPSFEFFQSGHGKTVIAEAVLTDEAVRRVLRTTVEDLLELVGGHAWGHRERDAVGCVYAGFGDRGAVRLHRPGPRDGRNLLDGARDGPAGGGRAARFDPLPGLGWGPSAAGRRCRSRTWLGLMGCAGAGRFIASPSSWLPPRSRWRSRRRRPWPQRARRTSSVRTTSAAAFAD